MKDSGSLKTAGVGTLVYMAPEVCPRIEEGNVAEKRLPYNKTVDIYSVSLVMHELIGGHGGYKFFPCSDPRLMMITVCQAKSRRDPPQLQKLPIWPETLQGVIRRGVDADPQKRPSLKEFSEVIQETRTRT